ncbi:MAG: glycosyltransferase family 2 protein [Hyphomonadaceae bacterium]
MRTTQVSVIVPTCDRPKYLRQALASIRALETGALKFEILVGDNGKDPSSRAIAEEFGAIHMKVDRPGAGAARNAGLKAATGEFIAFLDDDDVWMAKNVVNHIAMLEADPKLDGVFGQIVCTDMDLRPIMEPWPSSAPDNSDALVKDMLSGYYPQLAGTVVRTRVRDEIGLFDESLLGDQDWDWQLRVARRRHVGFTPTQCVLFRQRPPGSFDKLRLRRLGFGRKVFFRHAVPEWRLWKSPFAFMGAYTKVVWQYFDYFTEAAIERSEQGERKAALGAVAGAFRVFPLRTLYHLVVFKPLGRATFRAIWPGRSKPRAGAA